MADDKIKEQVMKKNNILNANKNKSNIELGGNILPDTRTLMKSITQKDVDELSNKIKREVG